jgi:hypothetical protein
MATSLKASVGPWLQHEGVGCNLLEWGYSRMFKTGIGRLCHGREFSIADFTVHKGFEHLHRHSVERFACKAGNGFGRQLRPALRQVQPAITGKARQNRITERQGGCFTACGNIAHEKCDTTGFHKGELRILPTPLNCAGVCGSPPCPVLVAGPDQGRVHSQQ